MTRLLIICSLMTFILLSECQRPRRPRPTQHQTQSGGKMGPAQVVELIKNAVPGQTFPAFSLDNIPQTSFSCDQSNINYPGYYADPETGCQSFNYCPIKSDGPSVATTFLCPNFTIFDQRVLTCRWFYEVDCDQAVNLYDLANSRLYIEGAPLLDD